MKIAGYQYVESLQVRSAFQKDMLKTFALVDAVVMHSPPTTAIKGIKSTGLSVANVPWSFSCFPAISLPFGLDSSGLPFGIQLVGYPWAEKALDIISHVI